MSQDPVEQSNELLRKLVEQNRHLLREVKVLTALMRNQPEVTGKAISASINRAAPSPARTLCDPVNREQA